MGEQNATVGTATTHRPTDMDGLAAQTRAAQERFPGEPLSGFTSDFAKACKQVPADPAYIDDYIIAQYDPDAPGVIFWRALTLLFGGKCTPLQFSRCPAWFAFVMAALIALPMSHCVDDMIGVERSSTVMSGWLSWRAIALLTGWDVPDSKSPKPSSAFAVIGAVLDLTGVPSSVALLAITRRRCQALRSMIMEILRSRALSSATAGSLLGKLGFATTQMFGRYGRARLAPFIRRAREKRVHLNTQLEECLAWWLAALGNLMPREIPHSLTDRKVVVSYSDGEGATAGVGVALWHYSLQKPVAAYLKVPRVIRLLWAKAKETAVESERLNDIFSIEAVGPLVVLNCFGHLLRDELWLHFIDNVGAQMCLVKGSASVHARDSVIGYTWDRIAQTRCLLWTERVASASNPVDGLSRGKRDGPWESVLDTSLPPELISLLHKQHFAR